MHQVHLELVPALPNREAKKQLRGAWAQGSSVLSQEPAGASALRLPASPATEGRSRPEPPKLEILEGNTVSSFNDARPFHLSPPDMDREV